MILAGALARFVAPYGYNEIDLDNAYQPPSWQHIAGTDEVGRDIFSRLIFSLQTALAVAFGATVISVVIGGVIGAVSGYSGGVIDNILMRITDVMYAFPGFLFSIILVSVLGRGMVTIFIAIAATSWVGFARLMRAQVLSIKNLEYVESARALGAPPPVYYPAVYSAEFLRPADCCHRLYGSRVDDDGIGVEPAGAGGDAAQAKLGSADSGGEREFQGVSLSAYLARGYVLRWPCCRLPIWGTG